MALDRAGVFGRCRYLWRTNWGAHVSYPDDSHLFDLLDAITGLRFTYQREGLAESTRATVWTPALGLREEEFLQWQRFEDPAQSVPALSGNLIAASTPFGELADFDWPATLVRIGLPVLGWDPAAQPCEKVCIQSSSHERCFEQQSRTSRPLEEACSTNLCFNLAASMRTSSSSKYSPLINMRARNTVTV